MKKSHLTCFENSTWNGMVYGPTGNRVAWLPLYNLNCKARNTPVDKTGVNFSCCSQGVLRTVDAPSLLFRLNRALELIRCCEKELCEIQTINNLLTTLNPVKLCFDTKRPYFGWLMIQNKGQFRFQVYNGVSLSISTLGRNGIHLEKRPHKIHLTGLA